MGILRTSELPVWGPRCDITHLLNEYEFFGVIPTNEDITAMNDNETRWMMDVAEKMQVRNTPDPVCGVSPLEVVFGRTIGDAFSFVNRLSKFTNPSIRPIWRGV